VAVRRTLVALIGITVCSSATEANPPIGAGPPLLHAHAHNDYLHDRPLLDALERGFTSVEADIFLVKGMLLVGHERSELKADRTLEALYLDPLAKRVYANNGRVFPGLDRFILLIDIKSNADETLGQLNKVLSKYAHMLTSVRRGKLFPNAVTIVLSGNRPISAVSGSSDRLVALDGRLTDLGSQAPADLLPVISDKWPTHFKWRGNGPIPADERAKLKVIVERAHRARRLVRFWATPENENVWNELRLQGVDLIGTDKLDRLANFLRKSNR
jgi:hypothetical protein